MKKLFDWWFEILPKKNINKVLHSVRHFDNICSYNFYINFV